MLPWLCVELRGVVMAVLSYNVLLWQCVELRRVAMTVS